MNGHGDFLAGKGLCFFKIGFEGIEDTVERFGASRLVFGSGMPNVSGASSVALLTYARISDEDKALIGSGNIKRLLSEVTF